MDRKKQYFRKGIMGMKRDYLLPGKNKSDDIFFRLRRSKKAPTMVVQDLRLLRQRARWSKKIAVLISEDLDNKIVTFTISVCDIKRIEESVSVIQRRIMDYVVCELMGKRK